MRFSFLVRKNAGPVFLLFLAVWILPGIILPLHLPPMVSRSLIPLFILFPQLWVYAIGMNLSQVPPEVSKRDLIFLRISILVAVACPYIFVFFFFGPKMLDIRAKLLFLLMNANFIYLAYSAARILLAAEKKEYISLESVASAFFLLLMFPVGIWFIQPRVQKVLMDTK